MTSQPVSMSGSLCKLEQSLQQYTRIRIAPEPVTHQSHPPPPTIAPTMASGESVRKKKVWPQPVRDSVARSSEYQSLYDDVSNDDTTAKLKQVINDATESDALKTTEWDYLPLPQQIILQERAQQVILTNPRADAISQPISLQPQIVPQLLVIIARAKARLQIIGSRTSVVVEEKSVLDLLPTEIRDEIYGLLLVSPDLGQKEALQPEQKYGLSPAILQTCRRVHYEASEVLYRSNAFVVSGLGSASEYHGEPLGFASSLTRYSRCSRENLEKIPKLWPIPAFRNVPSVVFKLCDRNISKYKEVADELMSMQSAAPVDKPFKMYKKLQKYPRGHAYSGLEASLYMEGVRCQPINALLPMDMRAWSNLNLFKTLTPHPVENALQLAKYADDDNDVVEFKKQRKAIEKGKSAGLGDYDVFNAHDIEAQANKMNAILEGTMLLARYGEEELTTVYEKWRGSQTGIWCSARSGMQHQHLAIRRARKAPFSCDAIGTDKGCEIDTEEWRSDERFDWYHDDTDVAPDDDLSDYGSLYGE
ncbi:uncharacterized protein PAC_08862 [Phialocephala subalpina]|uniref:F-box domain-containing protein n=1 Tax=Phialocephala subalpina TaxID=576137 RepID=A0A1L7X1T1_9HELO|nr:uncharacterized protein PAC_08862 [Phialocephala subalpina]